MDNQLNETGSNQAGAGAAPQPMRPTFEHVQAFLSGERPGPRGLLLAALLAKDDDFFEACHDFVQWLFPLNTPSAYHPHAPVLEVAELAKLSPAARAGTEQAFDRMMRFYGLVYEDERVVIGPNWNERMQDWAVVTSHNSLRLTRVLRSLSMQGHQVRAQALLDFLRGLFVDHLVSVQRREELAYWKQAVARPWVNGLA